MRLYGKVETTIWRNPKFRSLSERGRLLALYVFACPHGNSVGCFVLPNGYVAEDMEWDAETVSKHIKELVSKHVIERDPDSGLTRIVGWWGHNKIENPNVAIAALKCIKALPQASPVFANFINDLKQSRERYQEHFKQKVWEVFENGLANGLANHIETKEPEPEPEPEPEKEPKKDSSSDDDASFWNFSGDLAARASVQEKAARGMMGKLLKAHGGNVNQANVVLMAALNAKSPIAYIAATIKQLSGQAPPSADSPDEALRLRNQLGYEPLSDGEMAALTGGVNGVV